MLSSTRNLFDGMPTVVDDERANRFMLEIEAANAKTKTEEVALTSMMMRGIMKVDLNTVSPINRSWFEKMQTDMLKFNDE
ncbi:Protein UXT-like protein [Hordeum vulgare]|nr:Protein UXT-like protein [Hordeum vulgare]